MIRRLPLLATLGLLFATVYACGSSDDDNANNGNGAGNGNGALDGAFANNNNSGDGAGGDGGNNGNCFAPVDMYVMFDRSGSMRDPLDDDEGDCNIGQNVDSKWCKAINALSGYFNSAGAQGQAAALQFFPHKNHNDNLCDNGNVYNAAVFPTGGFVELKSNAFDSVLNAEAPGGGGGGLGTPTEAAIRGLVRFTAEPANRRPGRVTIGVLITDGDPNGCEDRDLTKLSDLLQAHYQATNIRTYVIGMEGATFSNLEEIAQGGNAPPHAATVGTLTNACGNVTAPCRHWNVGDGNPAAFIAAMAAIQESADGCKPGGGTVNPPK